MRGGESLLFMSFRLYLTALEYHTFHFQLAFNDACLQHCILESSVELEGRKAGVL